MESSQPLPGVNAESIGKCRPRTLEYVEGLRCAADMTERADQRLGQFLLEGVTVKGNCQRLHQLIPPTAIP